MCFGLGVQCCKQCLDGALEEQGEAQRELPLAPGELHLDLSLKIHLLQYSRRVDYFFELKPMAVDRIAVLESKLTDQQQKLEDQQEELGRLRVKVDTGANAFLCAEIVVEAEME
jgi:hypothetical protein